MANSEVGLSSDAARASAGEYQVFLNFRGPDTRYVFTDFLYHGLVDAGVRVFRDEEELRIGEVIGGNLLRAINNSEIYIPIFSQTYASSKWCLRELAHIVKNVSKSESQKSILPIFLDVEPEDIKLKTPRYSNALLEHEKNFPVEVMAWRKALVEVDEIKGWNIKKDESQATIAKLVVKRVLEKLKLKQRLVPEHLVGLDDRAKHLIELLDVNHHDVRLIGIYGMGGIGKTTVAKVVFNELSFSFGKCCSFLDDVRESMSTKDGIVRLQKKLLSDIVDSASAKVEDSEQGMRRIGETLGTKKVLVVLDDVDNQEQIKILIGNKSLLSGSRMIITTRNMAVMQIKGFEGKILSYEMLKMDDTLALELFGWHAFGRDYPPDDYHRLSKEIVSSTKGLPLAVKVLGSLLNGKKESFWKETLVRLKNVPEEEILMKLRISYDDLDKYQQQIFLDIACFFFNEKKTNAIYMWDSCQFYPERGIDVLTNRCLIKILDNDKLWMHDQLIDMGRRIVHQESPDDPGKRSRLWIAKEALEIIRTKERKDKVQALEIKGFGDIRTSITKITNKEFERFPNLRFLKLHRGTFAGNFAKCHLKLKWISWESPCGVNCDFRADNMYFNDLFVIEFGNNIFKDDSKAWDLIKRARELKVLSLMGCDGITTIPNFSECLKLERFTLANCKSLKRIESFIGKLQFLIELEIKGCAYLTDLPKEVGALGKLQRFSLWGCCGLRELPCSLGNLTLLEELDLSHTRIRELHTFIEKLKSLRILRFALRDSEEHAWHLLSGISMLVNLEELDLSRHNGMKGEISVEIGELSSLRILNLARTSICKMPRSINRLHHLQTLDLSLCHEIQELPELPTSLTCLLFESNSLCLVPNLSNLTNLVELQLAGGSVASVEAKLVPRCNLSWIGRLSRLEKLKLQLLNVPVPLELASLSHLKELDLRDLDLRHLKQFPSSSDCSGRNLSTLGLYSCKVEDFRLVELPRLERFTVMCCKRLQGLSISSGLTQLRQVDVLGCGDLVEIRVKGLSKSLEDLIVENCNSLTRISGLSCLKNLRRLVIWKCKVLTDVEGLDELKSLKNLTVTECESLRRLVKASRTKIPDDCKLIIAKCGNSIKDSKGIRPLNYYRGEILWNSSNKDEAERDVSSPDEDSDLCPDIDRDPASVDECEIDGNSSSDYFQSKPGNAECFEATGNGSQTKDESDGHSGNVNGGKMTSMEYRKEEKDESGEPDDQNDFWFWSSEDEGDLFSMEHPFTIRFHLGVNQHSEGFEFVGGILREKKDITPDSVTYEGLIADVKGFGFRMKRMCYKIPGEYHELIIDIKSDEQVKGMVQLASNRGLIHLYVEGWVDSEWEGEYDDEMMEMLSEEWGMNEYSNEDGVEWDVSGPDEYSDFASVGDSETSGTSSIDDFQSEPGNAKRFEDTGNRRQMRDGKIRDYGSVARRKTARMENRKKDKDEIWEPANQNDVPWSSCRRCQGTEHEEKSCKATTEVENQRHLSPDKRDGTMATNQLPTKTGRGRGAICASSPGRYLAKRGRGRDIASSSRNSKSLGSGKDTTSMAGKYTASNSGRSISSISQSSVTSSSGWGRGSTSGRGTALSSGSDTNFILGRGRGSRSKRGTTNMGASSSSGRSIASSSRSSRTLSTERGRGSPSGNGITVNSVTGATVSLERGTTRTGANLRSGTDKGSSSAKTKPQTSSS